MRSEFLAAFYALLPAALGAACSGAQQYNTITSISGSGACVPDGYFQAQDLGNTNPTDLVTLCENKCTAYGSACQAFVGQLWKAADTNLYSGQCYYYLTIPTNARRCVDHPTILIGEFKDSSLSCFSSSSAAARAYCSSILSIGTVTTYTRTSTPRVAIAVTKTTDTTTTSVDTEPLTSTSSTSTTSTVTTSTNIISTSSTKISTTTTTLTRGYKRRDETPVPVPSCLASLSLPSSRITSACSCINLSSATKSLVSTASASTFTQTIPATSVHISKTTIFIVQKTTITTSTILTTAITSSTSVVLTTSTSTFTFKTCDADGSQCDLDNPGACCGLACTNVVPFPTCFSFQDT